MWKWLSATIIVIYQIEFIAAGNRSHNIFQLLQAPKKAPLRLELQLFRSQPIRWDENNY